MWLEEKAGAKDNNPKPRSNGLPSTGKRRWVWLRQWVLHLTGRSLEAGKLLSKRIKAKHCLKPGLRKKKQKKQKRKLNSPNCCNVCAVTTTCSTCAIRSR